MKLNLTYGFVVSNLKGRYLCDKKICDAGKEDKTELSNFYVNVSTFNCVSNYSFLFYFFFFFFN